MLAIILHAMNVIKMVTQYVHPGHVPVITLDQPLLAIAKGIQWNLPNTDGESKFVGGLHSEMETLGAWLERSYCCYFRNRIRWCC